MAEAAAAMAIVGTGMEMAGNYKSAQEQAKAEKFNAYISEQRAKNIRQAKDEEIRKIRRNKDSMFATQKAKYAKAGVLFEGSPLEVMTDTATQFEIDVANTEYNYETEARAQEDEADYRRKRAKNIKSAGIMNAFATGAYGGSNLATNFYNMKQNKKTNKSTLPVYKGF